MKPTNTRAATHLFAKPANWNSEKDGECGDLIVRAETYGKSEIVQLVSTWKPSEAELVMLQNGGVIEVSLCTPSQPAMAVAVVEPFILDREPVSSSLTDTDQVTLDKVVTINEEAHGHGGA